MLRGFVVDAADRSHQGRNECVRIPHGRQMVAVDGVQGCVGDGVGQRELAARRHELVVYVDENRGRDVDLADPTVGSVLAERARGVEQLSPAEHRVMLAICEGRSTAEIADRFGRSKNTIRNQTRRVYEVMDVRTRSALVSKCATMGIVAGIS